MKKLTSQNSSWYASKKITSQNSSWYARYFISQARDVMIKARQKELKPYHITPQGANILSFLYNLDHKPTLYEISKYSHRGINTISKQMIGMVKDGLVKKGREVPKSTLLSFELTQQGIDIYNNSQKMRSVEMIMSVLSEEERQQLISMMKKIIIKAGKFK